MSVKFKKKERSNLGNTQVMGYYGGLFSALVGYRFTGIFPSLFCAFSHLCMPEVGHYIGLWLLWCVSNGVASLALG